ncbi:MAG: hypothetical protein AAGC55_14645, partial [Myxococcota bacterium]
MQSPDPNKLELLVLTRMSGKAKKPPAQSAVQKALWPYVQDVLTPSEWRTALAEVIERLGARGEVASKPLRLTEAGRHRVQQFLGTERALDWRTIRTRYLPGRALDLPVESERVRKRLGDADGVRGCLISHKHGLPTDPAPTLDQALDAWIWRQLGVDTGELLSLTRLKQHFLSQALGVDKKVALDKLKHLFAAHAVGARRTEPDPLRATAVQRWMFESGANAGAAPVQREPV